MIGAGEYDVVYSSRKTIGITVQNGRILVKAPRGTKDADIRSALARHERWIRARLKEQAAKPRVPRMTQADLDTVTARAKAYIPGRVAYFAPKVGVTYGKVRIKTMRSRWGSCTAKGDLSFNCLLMLCPSEVIDSVVVHELCHRRQMNHSKQFYREVYRVFPSYDEWHGWLKKHGGGLVASLPDQKT